MPAYAYTGLSAKGKQVKGVATADNVGALKATLKRDGVFLTSVSETTAAGAPPAAAGGAPAARGQIDLSGLLDRVTPKMVAGTTRLSAQPIHNRRGFCFLVARLR